MPDFAALYNLNSSLPFLGLAWVGFVIVASLGYRVWRGKPVLAPSFPGDAVFTESWTSGRSNRNVFTRLGGARNCLQVTLTPSELRIRPHFPFTLLFLPEIYDLELTIPRASIQSVEQHRKFFKDTLHISFTTPGGALQSVQLQLRRPQALLDVLKPG